LRAWPQAVSTDKDGVSLVMGLTAAAVDLRHAPKTPRVFDAISVPIDERPRGTALSVGLAPNILQPLTELLIDADVARIHLSDIPEKRFALLADRATLTGAIPELSRLPSSAEIQGELILRDPITVQDVSQPSPPKREGEPPLATKPVAQESESRSIDENRDDESDSSTGEKSSDNPDAGQPRTDARSDAAPEIEPVDHALKLSAPKVLIALSMRREAGRGDWQPLADLTFNVSQDAQVSVERPSFQQRSIRFAWSGQPAIECTAQFANGYAAENPEINIDKLRQIFLEAWQAWTSSGPLAQSEFNDVNFGLTKLRLNSASWNGEDILLGFAAPGVKITNESDVDLVYGTRGPYTGWGGPYTLAPGKSHEYPVAYPLTYRRRLNGSYSTFTLPAGSHVEFKRLKEGAEPSLFQARLAPAAAPAAEGGKQP
jgi:hypothetical protein